MQLRTIIFILIGVLLIAAPLAAHNNNNKSSDKSLPKNTYTKDTQLHPPAEYVTQKNKVIVLGMIHRSHTTSERYSLNVVKNVIRKIDPDYILTEIPPDRLGEAVRGFTQDGIVSEPRVKVFPEYKDVVFPLSKEMDFKIIPNAAWSQGMADYRREALARIKADETRAADWEAYLAANAKSREVKDGRADDPFFIHSDEYDAITKTGLSVYAKRFADELGRGDWERINAAHYKLIETSLENHAGEGATLLITFGAGHKYWFLEQLRKRDDIILINPTQYFKALETP